MDNVTIIENGEEKTLTPEEYRIVKNCLYKCEDKECGFYHIKQGYSFDSIERIIAMTR